MTLFSFEVPLKHLEDFDEDQDFYFALSFLCRESDEYLYYLEDRVREGCHVVLDNSYNELNEPDVPEELVRIFNELGADAVVSPDSDKWSFDGLNESYQEMLSLMPSGKVWVVVRNEEEFHHFRYAARCCSTFYHRPQLPLLNKCTHYLGLASLREIQEYEPISCDTSMPIKLALKGRSIEQWVLEGCPHYHTREWPSFFKMHLTDKQIKLAKENICKLKALAKIAP